MEYDKSKYKVWTWKNALMLHWIINPGVAFNELVLGLRVPKITLIEKDKSKPIYDRTFIPCPHCGTLHSAMKWSSQNKTAYRNWFGLYCDHCGKIIPCLTNLTSYLLLGITFPIWIWFKDKWKAKWLEQQKIKFSKPMQLTLPKVKWWRASIGWGFFMYVFMEILFPLLGGEKITSKSLLTGIITWSIGGLIFGLILKYFLGRKKIKTQTT